ncbi:hypothetical protein ACFLXO_03320 [Chloroflexota bacterium]
MVIANRILSITAFGVPLSLATYRHQKQWGKVITTALVKGRIERSSDGCYSPDIALGLAVRLCGERVSSTDGG